MSRLTLLITCDVDFSGVMVLLVVTLLLLGGDRGIADDEGGL